MINMQSWWKHVEAHFACTRYRECKVHTRFIVSRCIFGSSEFERGRDVLEGDDVEDDDDDSNG